MPPVRSCLCAVLLLASATTAHAQSVTFNLTGEILPGVCQFTANDVDLGTYYATDFTGAYAGTWVDVPIQVTRCDPLITRIAMRISGLADAAQASYFRGLAGVGIEVQQGTTNAAVVPAGSTLQYTTITGTYLLRARLRQSAASVAAGRISSPVTVTLSYN